jgi:hypothetical protein
VPEPKQSARERRRIRVARRISAAEVGHPCPAGAGGASKLPRLIAPWILLGRVAVVQAFRSRHGLR